MELEDDHTSVVEYDNPNDDIVNNLESDVEANSDKQVDSSSNSSPEVSDQIKPKVGQEFKSLDDVYTFYNAYAKEAGFSVRIASSKKDKKTEEITRKEYLCSKEGKSKKFMEADAQRRRGQYRGGCGAKLVVVKKKESPSYNVTIFNEEHNHVLLTPTKTPFLRSHRQVSSVAKCLNEQLSMVNVPTHQQYNFLQVQAGGINNIGYTQKDLYNHQTKKRLKLKGRDGDMLHDYFKSEQVKNPAFYFKIDADKDQKITRCFWADSTMRRSYRFYNDVVVFDSTYNTNRYGMIFAPILGVNNHRQTITFACALLNGEPSENFVWMFRQFLDAMPGDAPKMIITDQDPAMAIAISEVLPDALHRFLHELIHLIILMQNILICLFKNLYTYSPSCVLLRYCIWHIMTKFSEKIGAKIYAEHEKEFGKCIWNSETPEEFDQKWTTLVEKNDGLKRNEWLVNIYRLRSQWIPAYVSHVFSANMSSSQRAESSHAFLKIYIDKSNSLFDFMVRFGRGLVKQRLKELVSDTKDLNERPKLRMSHNFLDHVVDIYTHEIYYMFEEEMWVCLNYKIEHVSSIENRQLFTVQMNSEVASRGHELTYDRQLDFASCSCRLFESFGIPCRHILSYLVKHHNYLKLPEQYIHKRWTKEAKVGTVIDDSGILINDDKEYVSERSQVVKGCIDMIDKALKCEEAKKILKDGLETIREKIDKVTSIEENSNHLTEPIVTEVDLGHIEHVYNEPDKVRAKGCGKRLKGGKEKAMIKTKANKKARKCNACGEVGQAHDARNCPTLQ